MLTKRNGIYYYRRAIPSQLRTTLQKSEIIVSLKTRCSTIAFERAKSIDLAANRIIKKAYYGDDFSMEFDKLKSSNFTQFETETKVEENLDGSRKTTTTSKIDPAVIRAMTEAGVSADQIALTIREFLENSGQLPKTDAQTQSNLDEMRQSVTVSEYVKRYIAEWEQKKGRDLDKHQKTQLRRLCELLGDKSISDVRITDAAFVRDELKKLPKSPMKFLGLTVQETIKKANSEGEYKSLTITSIERHFETYITLFNQASDDKLYQEKNPFKQIELITGGKNAVRQERKRRSDSTKQPYSVEDLTKIFSTPLYTDFGSRFSDENARFWIPLIALFTGTRMSQVASLYCEDIHYENDFLIIDFNYKTPDRDGKTDFSFRKVPAHPLLIRLGLYEFARKVDSYKIESQFSKSSRLFPELRTYNRGTYAKRLEEWFNRRYLPYLNVRQVHDNKSFHAFRTTLLQMLRNAGSDEFTRNSIIGWSQNEDNANLVVREHYDNISFQDMFNALSNIELPNFFEEIKPFNIKKKMSFERIYRNQYSNTK